MTHGLLYGDIELTRVDDSICLTVYPSDDGDAVELWLPARCAATAGAALIGIALGVQADRVKRKLGYERIHVPGCSCDACEPEWTAVGL